MTRRLILIRHGKSSWAEPGMADHDRPLNKRGRQSAEAIGKWLREMGYLPDRILCSTAVRAHETCERLNLDVPTDYLPELYNAPPETIMSTLRKAQGQAIALVGHNPGIGAFANALVTEAPPHGRFEDFPTCATLVADLPAVDWNAGEFHTGRLQNFITPRELIGN